MSRPKRELKPFTDDPRCGSARGYWAHQRRNEVSCEPCRVALAEHSKTRYHENHEHHRKLHRKSYLKNWDQRQVDAREWQQRNPNKVKEAAIVSTNKRRVAKQLGGHNKYAVAEILETYGINCYICGKGINLDAPKRAGSGEGWEQGLHIDHLVPLSKGGNDSLSNVRPTHAQCNLRKHASLPASSTHDVFLSDSSE